MTRVHDPIDITDVPELRRIAEEVRDTNEPRVVRVDGEDVAMLVPLEPNLGPRKRTKTQADYDAVMSAAGGWKGLVDPEQLKADLRAARGHDRSPVESSQ